MDNCYSFISIKSLARNLEGQSNLKGCHLKIARKKEEPSS